MLRRGRVGVGGKIDKTDTFMTMNWMTKVKLKKSRLHLTLNSSVSIHADELLTNQVKRWRVDFINADIELDESESLSLC